MGHMLPIFHQIEKKFIFLESGYKDLHFDTQQDKVCIKHQFITHVENVSISEPYLSQYIHFRQICQTSEASYLP